MIFVKKATIAIGKRIQMMRESKEFSQEELAEDAKISVRGLQDIEHGKTQSPGIGTLTSIARALGVFLEDIVDDEVLSVMRPKPTVKTQADLMIEIVGKLPLLNEKQLKSVLNLINTATDQTAAG
jgi:transcriptional regulator with XRE-family HTH domain